MTPAAALAASPGALQFAATLASSAGLGYVRGNLRARLRLVPVPLYPGPLHIGRRARVRMPSAQADHHQLIESHHQRLVRWFYPRVHDRDTAEELAQRTWVEVLPRMHTYDPNRASFWTFTKVWAAFLLKRHWTESAARRDRAESESAAPAVDADEAAPVGNLQAHTDEIAELVEASEMHIELLRRALTCKRLPHEIIAFGIVKLLDWPPKRVVAELSEAHLDTAAALLESEYFRHVPQPEVPEAFAPLRAALARTLASHDLDSRIAAPYTHLAERITGTIVVRDYYPPDDDPEAAVTRWWAAVARVICKDLSRLTEGRLAHWLRERCRGLQRTGSK